MSTRPVDLRILILADSKLLPDDVQKRFDEWRIWRARDAVAKAVRKRLLNVTAEDLPTLQLYLERLEQADTERTVFEGIYALAEAVEHSRKRLGMHSGYVVLIMSGHLNPWGLLEIQQDFEHPAASVVAAAEELWELAAKFNVNIPMLLAKVKVDATLAAMEVHRTENVIGKLLRDAYGEEPPPTALSTEFTEPDKPSKNERNKVNPVDVTANLKAAKKTSSDKLSEQKKIADKKPTAS